MGKAHYMTMATMAREGRAYFEHTGNSAEAKGTLLHYTTPRKR
jgi:hypothetical protein